MIALMLALTAHGQDICDTCSFPTVQAAVDSLPIGGQGVFTMEGGYYDAPVVIDEGRQVSLIAITPEPAVLSADPGTGAVLDLRGGSTINLTGIYIDADGLRGIEAIEGSSANLTLSVVIGGGAVGEGALIRARDGSSLDIFASAMFGGLSNSDGGQILAVDSDVHTNATTFFDGSALVGGTIAARATGTRRTIHIESTTIDGSTAVVRGGALDLSGELDVLLDSIVYRNCNSVEGGALAITGNGPVVDIWANVSSESSSLNYGGFLYQSGGLVRVDQLAIGDAVGTDGGGIALLGGELIADDLVVTGSTLTGRGGGLFASGGTLTVRNSLFIGNYANTGGGFWLGPDVEVLEFSRTTACENESIIGGGAAILTTTDVELLNARFLGNLAFSDGGAILHDSEAGLRVRAVNLLGNTSSTGGASGISTRGQLEVLDALVAFQSGGIAVRSTGPEIVYGGGTVWWSNEQGDGDDLEPTADYAIYADPQLLGYVPGEDCFNIQDYGSWYGPLRDAGSEDLLDLDGTRADIGAYGGPDAALADWITDEDADGVSVIYDCDESDPETHPTAPDAPYDGLDTNCDGADDYDADGDGFRPQEYGGIDCDDTRADVYPGAPEVVLDPPVDQNCDGLKDADGDGYEPPEDCDDGNPDAHPGAVDGDPENDLDCDGFVDGPQLTRAVACDAGASGPGAGWLLLALAGVLARRRPLP